MECQPLRVQQEEVVAYDLKKFLLSPYWITVNARSRLQTKNRIKSCEKVYRQACLTEDV